MDAIAATEFLAPKHTVGNYPPTPQLFDARSDVAQPISQVVKFTNRYPRPKLRVPHRIRFVFVTPEYNRSIPAVLKNAIDYLFTEWHDKSAGFVGYGVNGGVAAVEHLRQICAEVKLADLRTSVPLNIADDFTEDGVPTDRHRPALHQLLDEVVYQSS